MQRLIPYGNTYAISPEFSVDEEAQVTIWLVRQDKTTTVGEAEADVQVKSSDDQFTTIATVNDAQPLYTLPTQRDKATYRVVRKIGQPIVAVDSTGLGENASLVIRPTAPSDLYPDPTQSRFSFKIVPADDADPATATGVSYPTGTANPPAYGLALSPVPLDVLLVNTTTGTDFNFTLTGPDLGHFSTGTLNLSRPDGNTVMIPLPVIAPGILTVTLAAAIPAGTIVAGRAMYVALTEPGVVFNPTEPTPRRFTLDNNDIPARVSAKGFDPGLDERVTFFVVEANTPIPATYEDEEPIELYIGFQALQLTAPGTYELQFPPASNISVYLNTGWN